MRYLIPLLAFLLIGCDGENSNVAPSKDSPEETASGTKPPEAVSVNPNLKYGIKGDAVTITGCDKKASGELIIPANIEGKTVTSIGNFAFSRCTNLTSITIPDSVNSIGEAAFGKCDSLRSITISKGVTSIGDEAFAGCSSLTSITIPDSVTSIGDWAFGNCVNLTSITIPDGVTSIGSSAFVACYSLTSITIPDSVTSIGGSAFAYCRNLTTVTLLGDAPKIENKAFKDSSPTIYRKPEAKDWGDTFAGKPVKLITEKP
ncbi:leucine-rich repeat domain-containing protein [Akkermansiaceae bacterium]|nr:leucine-rich repeat domain-containing protein [Akkermansiaceae bacterium]